MGNEYLRLKDLEFKLINFGFYINGVRLDNPFETPQGAPPKAGFQEDEPLEANGDD